jgi:cytochrome c oxidase subunit 3
LPDTYIAVPEQFDDREQQHEAASLGMWVFLATEILFFGGMFMGYTVYRSQYDVAFIAGSHLLDVKLGAINTMVLLGSSFTMALAVQSAQLGKRKAVIAFLLATMILGSVFLGIKLIGEYRHEYLEHLIPGINFAYEGPHAREVELFMCFYFAMTGFHALHMIIGMGIMTVLIIMSWRGRISPERHNPVEMTGLYWHFVDIIWIFLFPLLYLVGGRY